MAVRDLPRDVRRARRARAPGARVEPLSPGAVRTTTAFIDRHLASALQLEELAFLNRLSAAHFAKRFKLATGLTPHRYVLRRRIARARQLLQRTRVPINAIALRLGFASPSHLAAVFRRFHGTTPSAVRRPRATATAGVPAGGGAGWIEGRPVRRRSGRG